MRTQGLATTESTAGYARRFETKTATGHFRIAGGLTCSSIGLGTYLGAGDDDTDERYSAAARDAIALGCNVIDTAVNYRHQRSERAVGRALAEAFADGLARESVVVSTKGGFIPFDGAPPADRAGWLEETYFRTAVISASEVVADCHCISPPFIRNMIEISLRNLRLASVDIYYLHNPETQLAEVDRGKFIKRMRAVIEALEAAADEGKIGVYGTATWNGYRQPAGAPDHLSLAELVAAARDVAGDGHRFRALQLPLNLAMPEALVRRNQIVEGEPLTILEAASRLGMNVVVSGSLYQGQLASGLPSDLKDALPGLKTDAQRALQFSRSAPGVTTALVGMRSQQHVEENLALAAVPPAPAEAFRLLLD